jgi:hypothetical protein
MKNVEIKILIIKNDWEEEKMVLNGTDEMATKLAEELTQKMRNKEIKHYQMEWEA